MFQYTGFAEGVAAGRVVRVNEGLLANVTQQLLVDFTCIVVNVVSGFFMRLSTDPTHTVAGGKES